MDQSTFDAAGQLAAVVALEIQPARAALSEAATVAHDLNASLLEVMKNAKTLGYAGRVAPPFERFFMGGDTDIRGFDIRAISPIAFFIEKVDFPLTNPSGLGKPVNPNNPLAGTQTVPDFGAPHPRATSPRATRQRPPARTRARSAPSALATSSSISMTRKSFLARLWTSLANTTAAAGAPPITD